MASVIFFMKAIISGFSTGFAAAIPLGPSGIESIKRSLYNGFKEGFKVSLGAIFADYLYVILINLGFSAIINTNNEAEGLFWIISGIILIIFNRISEKNKYPLMNRLGNTKYSGFLSGFLITFLNPMTPSVWLALSGTIMSVWRVSGIYFYILAVFSMMIGSITWFIILNALAARGIKILRFNESKKTSNLIKYLMMLLGLTFIIFGYFKLIF